MCFLEIDITSVSVDNWTVIDFRSIPLMISDLLLQLIFRNLPFGLLFVDYAGETVLPGIFEELDPDGFDSIFSDIDSNGAYILPCIGLYQFKIIFCPFLKFLPSYDFGGPCRVTLVVTFGFLQQTFGRSQGMILCYSMNVS